MSGVGPRRLRSLGCADAAVCADMQHEVYGALLGESESGALARPQRLEQLCGGLDGRGVAYIAIAMAYIVMAYIVMAYIVMAYIVMAYIVMACLYLHTRSYTDAHVHTRACTCRCACLYARVYKHVCAHASRYVS